MAYVAFGTGDLANAYSCLYSSRGDVFVQLCEERTSLVEHIVRIQMCLDDLRINPDYAATTRAINICRRFLHNTEASTVWKGSKETKCFNGRTEESSAKLNAPRQENERDISKPPENVTEENIMTQNPSQWDPLVVGVWTWLVGRTSGETLVEEAQSIPLDAESSFASLLDTKQKVEAKLQDITFVLDKLDSVRKLIKDALTGNDKHREYAFSAALESLGTADATCANTVVAFGYSDVLAGHEVRLDLAPGSPILEQLQEREHFSEWPQSAEPCDEAIEILELGVAAFPRVKALVTMILEDSKDSESEKALSVIKDVLCACLAKSEQIRTANGVSVEPLIEYIGKMLASHHRKHLHHRTMHKIVTEWTVELLAVSLHACHQARFQVRKALSSCAPATLLIENIPCHMNLQDKLARLGDLAAEGNRVAFHDLLSIISTEHASVYRVSGAVQLCRLLDRFGAAAGEGLAGLLFDVKEKPHVLKQIEEAVMEELSARPAQSPYESGPWSWTAPIEHAIVCWPYDEEKHDLLLRWQPFLVSKPILKESS
eukprot:TRINITY_DN49617_c0_g1_i1.p1 TRINITY_DN49617_c0_g1~~TRINITY_DN49617_c0_g1_i1.p1  ORF type:complete len:545 (+),score=70.62 TRINITY_DN49617_c0_g1_i1:103-1737(+)